MSVGPVTLFMQPAPQEFGVDQSGYALCMMPEPMEPGPFQDPSNQLLYALNAENGVPPKTLGDYSPPGHWMPHMAEGMGFAAGNSASKAFDIKNPKTGKKIDREELLDKGNSQTRVLSPGFKAKWAAAAEIVAARMRSARWCADHSTFSALNVDGIRRPRRARVKGVVHPLPASTKSAAKEVPPQKEAPQEGVSKGLSSSAIAAFDARTGQNTKISAKAAANLAALSLEPCTEMEVHKSVQAAAAMPWKPRCMQGKDGADSQQDEPQTSAAESSPSLQEASDAASGEDESANEGRRLAAESALQKPAGLGEFFQSKKKAGKSPKAASSAGLQALPEAEARSPQPHECDDSATEVHILIGELLAFRCTLASAEVPAEIETLLAKECPEAWDPDKSQRSRPEGGDEPSDRALFGTAGNRRDSAASRRSTTDRTPKAGLPTPSATAYRAVSDRSPASMPRLEEMRRTVQSLLNKICPENVATIAEQIGEVKIADADEMESIIGLIFKKALAEPHYCETYADLVFTLKSAFPEFPSPDGGKPISFKATLLNICQTEFEALPTSLTPTPEETEKFDADELEFRRKKRKDRVLSNMKFIGHLFLRQLLSAKVIGSIIQELTLCDCVTRVPEEHVIECAVELLMAIGFTLESMPAGSKALGQVCGRLMDLKSQKGSDGKPVYCKRIQFAIQDLLDTRKKGWARKVFSGVAKTKEEIRIEQEKELSALARGKDVASGERVVAGQRPLYLSAVNKD